MIPIKIDGKPGPLVAKKFLPRRIKEKSKDPEQGFLDLLGEFGPLDTQELKFYLGLNKSFKFADLWKKLESEGKIVILREARGCTRVFGLPGDERKFKY